VSEPRTAKELLVWLHYGPDVGDLHPEDRAGAEDLVDAIEANGWRIVRAADIALTGHISHGEVLVENELLRDALRHLLAVARDVDRSMRDVETERCDDCDRLPGEGHDDDCGLDGLATGADYVLALLRGYVTFDVTPTSVGGRDG